MKLEGLRVLDLSLFLPGPMLTLMMADHGADVIKIEPPGEGEPSRHIGYATHGMSAWFRNTHRGKRSMQLDLKADAAVQRCSHSRARPTFWSRHSARGSPPASASITRASRRSTQASSIAASRLSASTARIATARRTMSPWKRWPGSSR